MTSHAQTSPGRRNVWEDIWARGEGPDFDFSLTGPTAPLPLFLDQTELPRGAALDVGCGDGQAARYLAGRFELSIGFDFAVRAVERAASLNDGSPASFLAADLTAMPFAPSSIAFAFDRGCFNSLPPQLRPMYFASIQGVLRSGGYLLMVARYRKPSGFHPSAIRKRLQLRRRRGVWSWPSEPEIQQLLSPELTLVDYASEQLSVAHGTMTHNRVLLRKS